MHIGAPEILLILFLVFLLFGAKKLPDAARSIGKAFKAFKREMKDIKTDMEISDSDNH